MRGIRYQFSIPNYLAARALDHWAPTLLASGRTPGVTCVESELGALPGPEWLRLRPLLCGVCGSDMALLTGKNSPALSPFASFPAVLGHEIVAEVDEIGAAVEGIAPGTRVAVDPFISCYIRELTPCDPCRRGEPCLCTQAAEGALSPGMLIGFCRDLTGGWADEMFAHRTQVYPVPPVLSERAAVLIEPLSVALHAVLKAPPASGSRVLIAGGGTIGLCVLAALRLLDRSCQVTMLVRYPFQERMANELGADYVLYEGRGPGRGAGTAAARAADARPYRPLRGRPVYAGGFDWVYDCVGSPRSLDDSLRVAGPRGRVMLVACATEAPHLDWSFVWARELQIMGTYGYAREVTVDGAPHTFEIALRLLAERPAYPLAELVTHVFPLSRWRAAIEANLRRGRHHAIKTVFDCQAETAFPAKNPA